MMVDSEVHSTRRLYFEKIRGEHAAEFQVPLCDPEVYAFIDMPCPTAEELELSFQNREAGSPPGREDEQWVDYAAFKKEEKVAIGRLEATVIGTNAEVAYLFGPSFWGVGYAREGLEWLQALLIEQYGVANFWATVNPDNFRSFRLLKGLGYRQVPESEWPQLTSYDPGDLVFTRPAVQSAGEG